MRKTFLLTSILLLSATWALAQYSSHSRASDQNTTDQSLGISTADSQDTSAGQKTSDSQDTGASSEPSTSSQTSSSDSSVAPPSGSTSSMSAPSEPSAGMRSTFEGCLSQSGGKFTLTDSSGNSYVLTGKTTGLKSHVGHTIEVTGTATSAHKPGSMSTEPAGMEHQSLRVSSYRHVSADCKGSMH